jgi:3-phenylpropionate/cinnamic acid dioxygenase small subunit
MTDRDELVDLVCALAEHLDGRRWDRFGEVLTVDASAYGIGGGPDAIAAGTRHYLENCGPTQHLVAGHRVAVDGDRARITSRARVFHQAADGLGSYEVLGTYEDDAVRTADGWRIAHRTFVAEVELGDISVILGNNAPLHGAGGLVAGDDDQEPKADSPSR